MCFLDEIDTDSCDICACVCSLCINKRCNKQYCHMCGDIKYVVMVDCADRIVKEEEYSL